MQGINDLLLITYSPIFNIYYKETNMSFKAGDFRNEVENFIAMQNSRTQMAQSIIDVLSANPRVERHLVMFLNKEISANELRESFISGVNNSDIWNDQSLFWFFISFIDMKNAASKSLPSIIKDAGKAVIEDEYDYS